MDSKIKKLLITPYPSVNIHRTSQGLKDLDSLIPLIATESNQKNFAILTPFGSSKLTLIKDIILSLGSQSLKNQNIWYVAPSISLTPFSILSLKSSLGDILKDIDQSVILAGHKQRGLNYDSKIIVWSLEALRDHLTDLKSLSSWPDLLIFDDADYLNHPGIWPLMEEIMLCLPDGIGLLLLLSSSHNPGQVCSWLETLRRRPCQCLEINLPFSLKAAGFISSGWEIMPLLDKKRLSSKVKRILKEEQPFYKLRSGHFIKELISLLQREDLTPSLIILPSNQDCDLAFEACSQVNKSIGQVLTDPVITVLLDKYPWLKDYYFLSPAIAKRAAPFHIGHHPLWNQLVEHFLALKGIDVVFATIEAASQLSTKWQSVVFGTSWQIRRRKTFHLTQWEMDGIRRLLGQDETDQVGTMMVMHTPYLDPVHIKDLFLNPPGNLAVPFQINTQSLLSILALGQDGPDLLNRSTIGYHSLNISPSAISHPPSPISHPPSAISHPPSGLSEKPDVEESGGQLSETEWSLESFMAKLHEELPQAHCHGFIQAVASLTELRLRLGVRLSEIAKDLKRSTSIWNKHRLAKEEQELERVLGQLPCEKCPHFSFCQKKTSRKIKNLLDEYYLRRKEISKSLAGLKLDFQYYLKSLQGFGLADQEHHLTKDGILTHRTGLAFPQTLIACIQDGQIPRHDQITGLALAGGFVEVQVWDQPKILKPRQIWPDWVKEMRSVYEGMEPSLSRAEQIMLVFGILIPRPILGQSVAMLAYLKGEDLTTIAKITGVSPGAMSRLIDQSNYLWERIQ